MIKGKSDGDTREMSVLTEVRDLEAVIDYTQSLPYTGPVLIIHGTKDKIVRTDYSKRAAECYENAELHFIEGGAHGFNRKHDAEAIAILNKFASQNV